MSLRDLLTSKLSFLKTAQNHPPKNKEPPEELNCRFFGGLFLRESAVDGRLMSKLSGTTFLFFCPIGIFKKAKSIKRAFCEETV